MADEKALKIVDIPYPADELKEGEVIILNQYKNNFL